jgi:hypothetical protein
MVVRTQTEDKQGARESMLADALIDTEPTSRSLLDDFHQANCVLVHNGSWVAPAKSILIETRQNRVQVMQWFYLQGTWTLPLRGERRDPQSRAQVTEKELPHTYFAHA